MSIQSVDGDPTSWPPVQMPIIPGAGSDAPTVVNSTGGKQSFTPYDMRRMPHRALLAISAVIAKGHWKYDNIHDPNDRNWKLIPRLENENHAMDHMEFHCVGDESDFHLSHAACRILFALEQWLEEHPNVIGDLAEEARAAYDARMAKEAATCQQIQQNV